MFFKKEWDVEVCAYSVILGIMLGVMLRTCK